jgi:fucose permease
MYNKNNSIFIVLPVMFGFFIMGFVDLIGTAINYVKVDFNLNDTMANMLSLSCFLWFLVLSIPTGFLMNRWGRKNAVLISFLITLAGLVIPFFVYNFGMIVVAFIFIGIGNTIIQVALNPLVTNVVDKDKQTGTLTLGQFVKSLSSWLGPNVAAWFAGSTFGWIYVFPVFGLITALACLWLWFTPIREGEKNAQASFAATFALLKDKKILMFFIGILVLVGVDVGMNATLPKYLIEKCPSISEISQADQLKSYYYFIVKALGAFLGGVLLMRVSEKKFYAISAFLALVGFVMLLFSSSQVSILAATIIIALGYANLFAIIFSLALKHLPQKANEISSLLIVGVSGGVFATLLGIVSDVFGTQWAAIVIIAVVWLYIIWLIKPITERV